MVWRRAGTGSSSGDRAGCRSGPADDSGSGYADSTQRRLDGIRADVALHRERELRAQTLDAYSRLDEAAEHLVAAIVRVVKARAAWAERYETAARLAARQAAAADEARVESLPPPADAPWPTEDEHPTIWTLLQPDKVLQAPDPQRLKEEFRAWAQAWNSKGALPHGESGSEVSSRVQEQLPDRAVPSDAASDAAASDWDANWLGGDVRPSPSDDAIPIRPRRLTHREESPWSFPEEITAESGFRPRTSPEQGPVDEPASQERTILIQTHDQGEQPAVPVDPGPEAGGYPRDRASGELGLGDDIEVSAEPERGATEDASWPADEQQPPPDEIVAPASRPLVLGERQASEAADSHRDGSAASGRPRRLNVAGIGSFSWGDAIDAEGACVEPDGGEDTSAARANEPTADEDTSAPRIDEPAGQEDRSAPWANDSAGEMGHGQARVPGVRSAFVAPTRDSRSAKVAEVLESQAPAGSEQGLGTSAGGEFAPGPEEATPAGSAEGLRGRPEPVPPPAPEPIPFVRPRTRTDDPAESGEPAVEPLFLADDQAFEA